MRYVGGWYFCEDVTFADGDSFSPTPVQGKVKVTRANGVVEWHEVGILPRAAAGRDRSVFTVGGIMQKDPREAGHPHTHDETVEEDDVQSEVAGEEQDLEEAEGGEEKDEEYSEPND